jgi:hypothetical protein
LTHLLKDVLSRGLLADLPSVQTRLLERALAAALPEYRWSRIVATEASALRLASRYLGREIAPEEVHDPALDPPPAGSSAPEVARWRPLLAVPAGARAVLPVLPFAAAGAPAAVCFAAEPPDDFPASEPVSPVLLAGAARCLYDLRRYQLPDWYREDLLGGARGWRQRGIYLRAEFGAERYEEVFTRFLESGVLLNPCYPGPSILPAEASPGEAAKMMQLFLENPVE